MVGVVLVDVLLVVKGGWFDGYIVFVEVKLVVVFGGVDLVVEVL